MRKLLLGHAEAARGRGCESLEGAEQPLALQPGHHEHIRRHHAGDGPRHGHSPRKGAACHALRHAVHHGGLAPKVELCHEDFGELLGGVNAFAALEHAHGVDHLLHVTREKAGHVRVLDFHGDLPPVVQRGAMHLPHRRGADGLLLEAREEGRGRLAERVLEDLVHLRRRPRRHTVLKHLQLPAVGERNGRENRADLAELEVDAPELDAQLEHPWCKLIVQLFRLPLRFCLRLGVVLIQLFLPAIELLILLYRRQNRAPKGDSAGQPGPAVGDAVKKVPASRRPSRRQRIDCHCVHGFICLYLSAMGRRGVLERSTALL